LRSLLGPVARETKRLGSGPQNFAQYIPHFSRRKQKHTSSPTIYNALQMLEIVAGLGVGGLIAAGYNTMAPESQLYGRTFTGKSAPAREIALTYDDGPNDPYTFQLLEILAKHNAKATFFMIGKYVDCRPDIARAVAEAGHVIGNHTYTHPNLILQSRWQVTDEIQRCERALDDAVGERHAALFRPPFGGRRPATLRQVRKIGLAPVMWNITGFDWRGLPAETIMHKVDSHMRDGAVILLHDGGHVNFGTDRASTVAATDHFLERYQGEGFNFRTIPELMVDAASPS
jgi:peptidoglycan-N-acetylglucosamine deacetylase